MADENPNGRYHLVESPQRMPGVDWITRTHIGPFIDTGLDIQFSQQGRFYISLSTLREMAEVAGFFDAPEDVGGLLGNLKPRYSVDQLQAEYDRGVNDTLKENLVGHLRDIAAELVAAADRLAGDAEPAGVQGGADVAASDAPGAGDLGDQAPPDDHSPDLGTAGAGEGDHKAAAAPRRPRGQGNGTGRDHRPVGVSSGASDGDNPFTV